MSTRLLRAPLLHFAAIGGLLFAGKMLVGDGLMAVSRAPIRIDAAAVERVRREWTAEMRREPSAGELEALVRRHADEETLHREALRLGLDRSDPVARRRLIQNMRFVRGGAGDDGALLAEALALGMGRHDPVVRRRLVQAMEARLGAGVEIDEDELRAYVARHAGRYASPRRVAFAHVFVSNDRHRDAAIVAARVGHQLGASADAAPAGDPFLLGRRMALSGEADIARGFGPGFAAAALRAPVGRWSGPVPSPYGLHWIFVESEAPAAVPDFAAVRRQAYYALLDERERDAVRAAIADLRRRYPIEVEWPALALAASR